jgi:diguanylate cyclase (GGDEF)-like protein
MMAWLSPLMILTGMVLLAAALPSISSILGKMGKGNLRTAWRCLRAMIILFLAGYAGFAFLLLGAPVTAAELIVSAILMAGGAFVLIVARLSHLTTNDIVRIAALERDVMRDPLTGVFNRRYLDAKLDEETSRSRRSGQPLSTLVIDLDHFKHINDTYGHPIGDQVIRHVCALIAGQIRTVDTVVRYGGEEFVVVAPDSPIEAAAALGNRMISSLNERILTLPDGTSLAVTASIGAAQYEPGETCLDFLARADGALYEAKRGGRNRLHIASPRQLAVAM